MRKLSIIVVALILVIGMVIPAGIVYAEVSVPNATSEFYVNDFAGVFSSQEKAKLLDNAVDLANTYDGIQVVVTTVNSLQGYEILDYAVSMYQRYAIGKNDMGVLILLSTGDREIFVNTGLAMEAYLTDSKVGSLIDKYAIPYFSEDQFAEGLISLQEAIISEIKTRVSKDIPHDRSNSAIQDPVSNTESQPTVEVHEPVSSTENGSSDTPIMKIFSIVLLSLLGLGVIAIFIGLIINRKNLQEKLNLTKSELEQSEARHNSETRLMETRNSNSLASLKSEYESDLSSMRSQYQTKIRELENKNASLNSEFGQLRDRFASLTRAHSSLQEYRNRAKKLHPKLDEEIDAMIAREIEEHNRAVANSYDSSISSLLSSKPASDSIIAFESAIRRFHDLEPSQQGFVKSDISKLESLLSESKQILWKQQAEEMSSSILDITSGISIANASHLEVLRSLSRRYTALDSNARQLINNNLIENFNRLLRQAQEDQDRIEEERRRREEEERRRREEEERRRREEEERRRREEEERRRREEEERRRREQRRREEENRRMSSFSWGSSSSSSSSHSGFGGRTGGGGAGRKF